MTGYPFDNTFQFRGVPAAARVLPLDLPGPRLTIAKLVVVQASGSHSGFTAVFYNCSFAAGDYSIDLDSEGKGPLAPEVYQVGPTLVAANGVAVASAFGVAYPFESQELHQNGVLGRRLYLVLTPAATGDFHVAVGGFRAGIA